MGIFIWMILLLALALYHYQTKRDKFLFEQNVKCHKLVQEKAFINYDHVLSDFYSNKLHDCVYVRKTPERIDLGISVSKAINLSLFSLSEQYEIESYYPERWKYIERHTISKLIKERKNKYQ